MRKPRQRDKRTPSTPYYPSQRRGTDDRTVVGLPRGF